MTKPFEPTRSFVYNTTRYELLPRIAEEAQGQGDKPFLMREITKKLLEERFTPEQLDIRVKKAQSERYDSIRSIFGFYVPFLADELKYFENVGGGWFKNISIDEEMAEAEALATDEESNDAGIIYAYTFPLIKKDNGPYPIKVGLSTMGDAQARVMQQCRGTICFEYPVVLKTWSVQRVAKVERAIHTILDARGVRRDAPGAEWFDTTVDEIESIVSFVQS